MPNPDDFDFLVLRAMARHYERGTVTRETLRQVAGPHERAGVADAALDEALDEALDAALARLRSDGHVVAHDGRYTVSPAVAAVLPRTRSGAVSDAAAPWQRLRARLFVSAPPDG